MGGVVVRQVEFSARETSVFRLPATQGGARDFRGTNGVIGNGNDGKTSGGQGVNLAFGRMAVMGGERFGEGAVTRR